MSHAAQPLPVPLADLAGVQAGVLSRRQVLAAGGTDDLVEANLRAGRWRRSHPGVYATHTGPVSRDIEIWAVLLYAGDGATVSHETAAELWGLVDDVSPDVHVILPVGRRVRGRPGVHIHYAHRLPGTRHPGRVPPVVSVEDTVLDLVDTATSPRQAVDWVSRACQRRKTTAGRLHSALDARKKIRWREPVQGVLADVSDGAETPLEQAYLRHVERAHGLPRGVRQRHRRTSGRTQWIDVEYAEFGVRVELDGRLGHVAEGAFRDRRRDNSSSEEGFITLRYGWEETYADSCATAVQVVGVLARCGWTGSPHPCGSGCTVQRRPPSSMIMKVRPCYSADELS